MKLTWRDAAATALVAAAGAVTVAVLQGWGWPLVGSYRTGAVAVGGLGLTACVIGGGGMASSSFRSGLVKFTSVLGGIAMVLWLTGMITGNRMVLIALAVDTGLAWVLATFRHATAGSMSSPRPAAPMPAA